MQKDVIIEIKSNYKFLTKTEKKIAAVIIENPKKFILLSMKELSVSADVSQGSIINFSNKFAKGGFRELKLQIAACLGNLKEKEAKISSDEKNGIKDILKDTIDGYNTAFSLTGHVNDESVMNDVANKILKAKKVEIYGIFRSAAVATDFCYQLLEIGIPASFVSDILTCSISASMLDENSVVIAISSSGKTRDIIDAVKNAKSNGANIISLTSNINSPLAKLSDYVLIASSSGGFTEKTAKEIRSSQILLADTICSYIRTRTNCIKGSRYNELRKILNSHNVEEGEDD